mgnify:CR=1 FL=1
MGPVTSRYAWAHLPLQADAVLPDTDLVTATALSTRELTARRLQHQLVQIVGSLVERTLTRGNHASVKVHPVGLVVAQTLIGCLLYTSDAADEL